MRSLALHRFQLTLAIVGVLGCEETTAVPSSSASNAGAPNGGESNGGESNGGESNGGESNGCALASATYPLGTSQGSIEASGTRTFRVHVPPSGSAKQPLPVVLMLHGGWGSALQLQTRSSNMDSIADREGFITVYPNGTGVLATWNGGLCCGRAVEGAVDDVAFVGALLDHLEDELCVDRRRIFAMGMSNGALLSHRLGCQLSDRIAAIAPVAGTIGVSDCAPTRAVPVMQIHGTSDGHIPWEGGVGCGPAGASFISVPDTMEGWRVRNGCDAGSEEVFAEGDGRCTAYESCEAPVTLCAIDGAGHSWPGGAPKTDVVDCPGDGPQSQSFFASEVAWRFFSENPLP